MNETIDELQTILDDKLNGLLTDEVRDKSYTDVITWLGRRSQPGPEFQQLLPDIRKLCANYIIKISDNHVFKVQCPNNDGYHALVLLRSGSTWFLGGDVDTILLAAVVSQ